GRWARPAKAVIGNLSEKNGSPRLGRLGSAKRSVISKQRPRQQQHTQRKLILSTATTCGSPRQSRRSQHRPPHQSPRAIPSPQPAPAGPPQAGNYTDTPGQVPAGDFDERSSRTEGRPTDRALSGGDPEG